MRVKAENRAFSLIKVTTSGGAFRPNGHRSAGSVPTGNGVDDEPDLATLAGAPEQKLEVDLSGKGVPIDSTAHGSGPISIPHILS